MFKITFTSLVLISDSFLLSLVMVRLLFFGFFGVVLGKCGLQLNRKTGVSQSGNSWWYSVCLYLAERGLEDL